MKNVILSLFAFVFCAITSSAQVHTSFFQERDAFESFPSLRLTRSDEISTKRMPPVDIEKLKQEDRENEGDEEAHTS